MDKQKKMLTFEQTEKLLETLENRFNKNLNHHKEIKWENVKTRLMNNTEKLWSIYQMEITEGEPDVIILDNNVEDYLFVDCSPESPKGRRSLCYDKQALEMRKENKPQNSAIGMATEMGIELLDQQQYREIQKIFEFDLKTSSWIKTPENIRKLGGAVFCDYRYKTVFLYHNGAESYYSSRGFRGFVRV